MWQLFFGWGSCHAFLDATFPETAPVPVPERFNEIYLVAGPLVKALLIRSVAKCHHIWRVYPWRSEANFPRDAFSTLGKA